MPVGVLAHGLPGLTLSSIWHCVAYGTVIYIITVITIITVTTVITQNVHHFLGLGAWPTVGTVQGRALF